MQANDMLRGYDDRDDYEMREFHKAQREFRNSRIHFIIEDVPTGRTIDSDGSLAFMLKSYLIWAKEFMQGAKKQGEPFHFRLTLRQADGTVIRTRDFTRA